MKTIHQQQDTMKSKLNLQVNEPCNEAWNDMINAPNGRFCQSCTKVVVDFTTMTDREVLNFFRDNTGQVCGRFKASQLGREMKRQQYLPGAFRSKAAAALVTGSLLTASQVQGQTNTTDKHEKVVHECGVGEDRQVPLQEDLTTKQPFVFQGTVLDKETGEPIFAANILIEGTNRGTVTDFDGKFSIEVERGATLIVSYIGYEAVPVQVDAKSKDVCIEMKCGVILGDVEVVGLAAPYVEKETQGLVVTSEAEDSVKGVEIESPQEDAPAQELATMEVFPNPFDEELHIRLEVIQRSKYDLYVFSTDGKIVQKQSLKLRGGTHLISIDMRDSLPAGQYIVHVRWKGGQINEVIVKQ